MTTKLRRLIWKSPDLRSRKRIECTLGSIYIGYIYIFDAYLFCLDIVYLTVVIYNLRSLHRSMYGGKDLSW